MESKTIGDEMLKSLKMIEAYLKKLVYMEEEKWAKREEYHQRKQEYLEKKKTLLKQLETLEKQ